ncbi:MAG TPA: FtsX-like permease family protein [Verrucomicrobiae bacterium]|jgi:putative ABC transport system permease protein|nr:FtsX-like permease family protein [Verrucomicrobiae bacterium]
MNKMIVANLAYRPLRSVISIVAVAVEVTLILLIVGLALGILNDATQRQTGVGADVLVRPPGSAIFNGFSSAPVPMAVAGVLRKQPHVVAVAPVVTQVTSGANIEIIYGVDLDSFQAVGGPLQYLEGGPFEQPYDMIVDDYYAAANHAHAGAAVDLFKHQFRIAGIIPHGRGGRRYIPIKTLQEVMGAQNKASIFYVKLDDPSSADVVTTQFKTIPGMADYNIMSMREWLSLMSADKIPGLATFINVVIGIAVIIGFIVIFQSMYTAVMERTREIGILKSLGASKFYIVRVILRETLLLAVAGIVVGMLFSVAARAGIVHRFPTLRVLPITWVWGIRATIIALGGAMLGAIYPAYKAAQKDPIDALAYE